MKKNKSTETPYMKIRIAQQNYIIGDIEGNTEKIITAILRAKHEKIDLLVFSELSICGYPPRDFLDIEDFIEKCEWAVAKIQKETQGLSVIIGAPTRSKLQIGKRLYNSALVLQDGQLVHSVAKTLLPTYDVFDENRYFESANEWKCVDIHGLRIALTICEDIWNVEEYKMYPITPMDRLIEQAPDLMINISASPFDYTHAEDRKAVIKHNVRQYKIPMLYSTSVGSQTEIVFDGGSIAMDKNQNILGELRYFEVDERDFEFRDGDLQGAIETPSAQIPNQQLDPENLHWDLNIERVHQALILGIRDYFSKLGFEKCTLGASGGIDSAVTQALAVEALGPQNVKVLLMPSQFSSDHSIKDAVELSENLKNPYRIFNIDNIYSSFMNTLAPDFGGTEFSVAEENIQSRARGVLLMAEANKFGYILLNTSNKSELAVGYGTLYGDMAGGLSVLGDVYKMQVYALAEYINREHEIIPRHILEKAPSAELRPDQKDSDSLPDYTDLDSILYQYIERQLSPQEIIEQGFEENMVYRIIKLVNRNEYKRAQFCPIIRISPKAFGIGRRIPIVARYLD